LEPEDNLTFPFNFFSLPTMSLTSTTQELSFQISHLCKDVESGKKQIEEIDSFLDREILGNATIGLKEVTELVDTIDRASAIRLSSLAVHLLTSGAGSGREPTEYQNSPSLASCTKEDLRFS
jgi:hypothetical protein